MKKNVLRVAAVILVVIMSFSLISCGKKSREQLPTPTDKFFVNDFAGVMSEADISAVYTKGATLDAATAAQVVIVTIEALDGKEASEYALELGRQWGVGDKDKNNGVVILLSENDREIYIAVGYGLEGALPDSKTGRIIDTYGMSYFSSNDFSTGLANIYNAVVNEVYIEYGIQPQENYIPIDLLPETQTETTSVEEIVLSWIVLIILVALYAMIFARRGGLFIFGSPRIFTGGYHHGGGFGGGGFGGFKGGGGGFGGGGVGRKF